MPDEFTAAIDRLCFEAQRVPVDVLATVAADLAGGPLEGLAGALHLVAEASTPDRPHTVARLLLCRQVVHAARWLVDDTTVEQMAASGDVLWRAAGEAIEIVRRSVPGSIPELRRWRLDE